MRRVITIAPVLLAACSTVPAAAPTPPARGASGYVCKREPLAAFAGRPATSETGTEILRVSGARTVRWVQPGMMVTMEFLADRVTVWLAPGNRIERASCG